jgi:hypothetical protein
MAAQCQKGDSSKMRVRYHVLTLAALLIAIAAQMASAEVVTWELTGRIDAVDGVSTRMDAPDVGDSFTVRVTFDTAVAPARALPGDISGTKYRFESAIQSYSFRLGSGPTLTYPEDFSSDDFVMLRDDFWDTERNACPVDACIAPFAPYDGISFSVYGAEPDSLTSLILLRSATTDVVNGRTLPADPDPRLARADMNLAGFYSAYVSVTGTVVSIRRIDR